MKPERKKINIKHVADAANVSTATVSRALNDKTLVKPQTYKKVVDAIDSLGYIIPKKSDLTKERSKLILVAVPYYESDYFFGKVMKGIEDSASRHHFEVIFSYSLSKMKTIEEIESLLSKTNAEGIIFTDCLLDVHTMNDLNKIIPVIQCNDYLENADPSYVCIDNFGAAKLLTEYLIGLGKRRIAFFTNIRETSHSRLRLEGYLAALSENNIEVDKSLIFKLNASVNDSIISAATQLFNSSKKPDAVFAICDTFAVATIKAAKSLNLEVPKDVSIAGFDNTDNSRICDPAITTIDYPRYQLGYIACEQLLERITTSQDVDTKRIMLNTELIIREST